MEVIVESFIDFDYEITLLTLTQNNGNTLFAILLDTGKKGRLPRKLAAYGYERHSFKRSKNNG